MHSVRIIANQFLLGQNVKCLIKICFGQKHLVYWPNAIVFFHSLLGARYSIWTFFTVNCTQECIHLKGMLRMYGQSTYRERSIYIIFRMIIMTPILYQISILDLFL